MVQHQNCSNDMDGVSGLFINRNNFGAYFSFIHRYLCTPVGTITLFYIFTVPTYELKLGQSPSFIYSMSQLQHKNVHFV